MVVFFSNLQETHRRIILGMIIHDELLAKAWVWFPVLYSMELSEYQVRIQNLDSANTTPKTYNDLSKLLTHRLFGINTVGKLFVYFWFLFNHSLLCTKTKSKALTIWINETKFSNYWTVNPWSPCLCISLP